LLVVVLGVGCGGGATPDEEHVPGEATPTEDPGASLDPTAPPSLDATERGKWRRRERDGARGEVPAAVGGGAAPADLAALPYLQGYRPARDLPTIGRHDPRRAWQGLNLAISGDEAAAVLFDMEGRVLHRWRQPIARVWPDLRGNEEAKKVDYWRRVRLLPDGSLLAIYDGRGLIHLSRDSRLLWAHRGGIHHDLDLAPDGSIHALDRVGKALPRIRRGGVLEDLVTVFEPDGRVRSQHSILEALERSDYAALLHRRPDDPDFLHTNTLELLSGEGAERLPALAAGNLLVSILELDALAIIDPRQNRVVWALAGLTRKQHQPTLLPGPRLLVFDNVWQREGSRVLELDPLTQQVLWRFPTPGSREELFSRTLGSVARLPNGNTLITESEGGRALEVTPDGSVVWEYQSPLRVPAPDGRGELVASLFEVVRLAADDVPWLPEATRQRPQP
jgi:hypothetical protein